MQINNNSNNKRLLATLCLVGLLSLFGRSTSASGIFELNLSSLTDLYGRDLRLDCCAWQNNTSNSPLTAQTSSPREIPAAAEQPCDPTKCQLIVRICVKNYQNQIDASQCTFGELSAQVMKPIEPSPLPFSYLQQSALTHKQQQAFRRQQQHQATSRQHNIHHQRMLQQQQQQLASSILSSGQSRLMRTIAFDQPISFPFNFTWPVSV